LRACHHRAFGVVLRLQSGASELALIAAGTHRRSDIPFAEFQLVEQWQ
jgi:hypothetical protein